MRTLRPRSATGFAALAVASLAALCGALPSFEERSIAAAEPQAPKSNSSEKKSEEKGDRSLRSFMRAKLSASTKILEGLALENLDLVREGAVEMNKMSTAEQWRRHDDVLYRQFSAEFRQTTSDLVDAAKEGLLDRAALKWMDATMNCIECHRYVRNKLVVRGK